MQVTRRSLGVFVGFKWKKGRTCLALGFETRKMREKEGKSQISSLYRVEHERAPATRLNSSAIDVLEHPRISTTEIKRPFEI